MREPEDRGMDSGNDGKERVTVVDIKIGE